MKRNGLPKAAFTTFVFIVALAVAWPSEAQDAKSPYPGMAPVGQYMMDRNAEIALARSAAPQSISKDAEVMVLGRKGYEIAVKGRNGFVCLVHRSWTSENDDPEFWNPTRRGPMCLNAAAAKSYLPNTIMRTNLVLAGRSKDQIFAALHTAFEKKELPPPEPGAMCYMMSKQAHLSDRDGRWHPHLMFFLPSAVAAAWGANLPGSPLIADEDAPDRMTIFMVPVATWSDGTSDSVDAHHAAAVVDDKSGRHALVLRGQRNATPGRLIYPIRLTYYNDQPESPRASEGLALQDADVPGFSVLTRHNGTIRHFYSGEMNGEMADPVADPGQDPRGAPDLDPLWSLLDWTPEGRAPDWYPTLNYARKD